MKGNRFDCCFENERKGIYFEVEDQNSHIELTMYNNSKPETQVCLRDEDVQRLIDLLQQMSK
ncbi:hypothetical protein ABHN03_25365 [Paenibacillus sp. NRS-1775]|uniref:hypothetical protein n=1 Tax=unclassified Paenibacillus TaxID=185978 RepID=UPI003D2DD8A3